MNMYAVISPCLMGGLYKPRTALFTAIITIIIIINFVVITCSSKLLAIHRPLPVIQPGSGVGSNGGGGNGGGVSAGQLQTGHGGRTMAPVVAVQGVF